MSEIAVAAPEKASELVTEDLVKQSLEKHKGPDAKLISFQLKSFTKSGDNYFSIVVSVVVNYKDKGCDYQEFYVAKMNPCLPNNPLTERIEMCFPLEIDILQNKIGGMNEQLNKLNLPNIKAPELYAHNLERGKQVFITENLRIQGFKMPDKMKGLDLSHALLVVNELGRFHASSLLYEETLHPKTIEESLNFKHPRYDQMNEVFQLYEKLMLSYAKVIIDTLKEEGPKYKNCVKWLHDHGDKMAKYFYEGFLPEKPFDILVHGDCRANNFLFRYDENDIPVDIRLLDFQVSKMASPATDLNYFFYTSLFGDSRVEKINCLLTAYYKSFSEVLLRAKRSAPFSYQELIQEVKNRRIYGFCSCVLVLFVILAEDTEGLFDQYLERNQPEEACSKNQSKVAKALLDEKNPLKKILLSVIDEFIEYKAFD